MRSVEQDEMGYLYLFLDRGNKRLCINAQNVPCPCYSELPSTYGRKINHSPKKTNLRPMVNYSTNDTRKSFSGEGQIYPRLMSRSSKVKTLCMCTNFATCRTLHF
ncbi:hypothetical protein XELAEV_18002986mg [Xenopus laevis]|nr:hypothetical protein XELAEV_18002986mg [Xenopus laevis]